MKIVIAKSKGLPACGDGCCHDSGFIVRIGDEAEHYFLTENKEKHHKEIQYLIEHVLECIKGYDHGFKFELTEE